eukprot:365939-Chlamydomonas_euryale.AAC.1
MAGWLVGWLVGIFAGWLLCAGGQASGERSVPQRCRQRDVIGRHRTVKQSMRRQTGAWLAR